jgi:hypothetical protein
MVFFGFMFVCSLCSIRATAATSAPGTPDADHLGKKAEYQQVRWNKQQECQGDCQNPARQRMRCAQPQQASGVVNPHRVKTHQKESVL